MIRYAITSIFFLIFFTYSAHAQTLSQSAEITLIPTNPVAGETVRAQVESFDVELSEALITWRYNGTIIASGTGVTTATFTAPNTGSTGTLIVTVRGSEGSVTATATLRPGALDLVWESPDTYTPPFYKGKALPAPGGTVRVTAIPSASAPRSLSYSWKYNGDAVQGQSGANRQTLTLTTNTLTNDQRVDVTARSGTFQAQESLTIPLRDPSIVLYQKQNGFIDYTQGTLRTLTLTTPGTTLRFEPFSFTVGRNVAESLVRRITLGGSEVTGQSVWNELPLSRPDTNGTDTVGIVVQSARQSFQSLERRFDISF